MSKNESEQSIKEDTNNPLVLNKSKESKDESENQIIEESKQEEKKIIEESSNNIDSKINSDRNNSNDVENKDNSNETIEEKNKKQINDDEMMIEVMDQGTNTDELNLSELERLVKANKELQEILSDDKGNKLNTDSVINIEHNTSEISQTKKALIEELTKNDEIKDLLIKSNNELSNKIKLSEKKFQEIIDKIGEKKRRRYREKIRIKNKRIRKRNKSK